MPSDAYKLFAKAIQQRKQVICLHDGYVRALCPIILGHTDGQEVALAYQFAGESSRGLPPGGAWRCLQLARTSNIELHDGRWYAGSSHQQAQKCVDVVDLDVNPASPYKPRRPLTAPRRPPRKRSAAGSPPPAPSRRKR
ncbi:MAG TPA: hypothetical protein VE963_14385 [Reyranella sp.]|nr:hypothetical protein [Reyranella sp.]